MKSTVLWTLVGLNAVLLLLFAGQFNHTSTAQAQVRRPSDYLMIPGEVSSGPTSLVYIIDTTNGRLAAVAYDDSSHTLMTMPAIDLNQIYSQRR
jgi:hypothetical protein